MIRVAHERIGRLFSLAEQEATQGGQPLSTRYVLLARQIGERYNVRVPRAYRGSYCRRCSAYWVEGRTVRSRLRRGRHVHTCLVCGAVRRVPLRRSAPPVGGMGEPALGPGGRSAEPVPVEDEEETPGLDEDEDN
jgi:ribonuclease P protein subunit RPR2